MSIPISSSLNELNANVFFREGFELSLDAIVPSVELTGSFTQFESKTQFFLYDYSKTILHSNLNYEGNGSFLTPPLGTSTTTTTSSIYNQFELNPTEDIYNLGYSTGKYFAAYNFVNYELGSEALNKEKDGNFEQHPYFIKDISGDRTELRIQNNFLTSPQIENFYNSFENKLNSRENVDEFYISFGGNRNFIGVNSQLEKQPPNSSTPTSILIKLYKPLPLEFKVEEQLQIISKVGETRVFEVEFQPNLTFIDNLLSLKGPNYNIKVKDKVNNSTNFKNLNDLINTNSSQSYYQFNSLQNQKGVTITKNWGDWNEFVKYSSAEQRLSNFYDKLADIENYEAELLSLESIASPTPSSSDYSSSYGAITNNINTIISKFDSYEYFLYYVTGSESWPKYSSTYPYKNFSVSSSEALNWYGSTDESSIYFNSGKNQIFSASIYDENNQDYLYYLIPPFITENSDNSQYTKFVNMTGQTFDEMYLYTEAIEQVRNTNSGLTGSVLPLGMAAEVIESLGFDTYGNSFNSVGFNVNNIGVFPAAGSGLEYITRYVDIASGSVINYYDTQQSTLGYVIALSDPSFPYPIENTAQEIYKRIFHNMISLVKRKGTVTGLRQLINIWGVPNTMLRISEFGGKNKNDENDYDLWMNRYSNAMSTIPTSASISSTTKASGSIRIPWQPLTGNYYEEAVNPDIAVPDCIQFRFKNKKLISSDSVFTSSLLLKNNVAAIVPSDFGIVLQYSGSQSGSFSGSVIPTDYQYGSMQFVISGSVDEGGLGSGYFETDPIVLPFFNDGWWSVQLQRKTHLSQSQENATLNEYELRVANNIYDGYDGNQIGFQGSASITMPGGKITSSINQSWNESLSSNNLGASNGVILGGFMNLNTLSGYKSKWVGKESVGRNCGGGFIGQFQEFKYYRRALSSSQFNDYVMNPESIQGHADSNTGAGSSYDLLSFRLPLGNELEYNNVSGSGKFLTATENGGNVGVLLFGGQNYSLGGNALGSVHPSLVNKKGSLYTSSFLNMNNYTTQSGYSIVYQGWDGTDTSAITASYLVPNTEINYMDQPAAGIRNRIKNKIQLIDGNEYGTTLSPFRSIQQEFEQSSSYTEDLNSLEVGFSFQNEINDDIIATFGHGVVSDAIADPRFISESSDRYPELTRIAEDYFKKYQGVTISDPTYNGGLPTIIEKEYDYNRLIKFYESSLFRAIKNYIPARTSLSTGIIVKQHLLERNKTDAVVGINIDNPIAKTPETGSNVYGYTDQTGFNSVISQRNLLITSSIGVGSITGSAGGSVNKYNVLSKEGGWFQLENDNFSLTSTPVSIFQGAPDSSFGDGIVLDVDVNGVSYLGTSVAFISNIQLNPYFTTTPTDLDVTVSITSSKRGGIFSTTFDFGANQDPDNTVSENFLTAYPDERLYVNISADENITMGAYYLRVGPDPLSTSIDYPEPSASQQVNWYIDNFTGEYKVKDTQEEFYDGEFSGSNFEVIPTSYNPYRIYADGSNKNPDQTQAGGVPFTPPVVNLAGGTYNSGGVRFSNVTATGADFAAVRATSSLVVASGSAVGAVSSDALLFVDSNSTDTTSDKTISIGDFNDVKRREYVNIGYNSPLYTSHSTNANNGKHLLKIGIDITSLVSINQGSINSGDDGTYSPVVFYSDSATGLVFEATVVVLSGIVGPVTVTNATNLNGTEWWKEGGFNSSATGAVNGKAVTISFSSLEAFLVQFNNEGTAADAKENLKTAIESYNGHNGTIVVTGTTVGSDNYLRLQQTTVGDDGDTNITYTNDFAANGGSGDTAGVILASRATGASPQYLAPTDFNFGVDTPSSNPNIYIQNAITNLTTGVTYTIDFDITNYATDGFGSSNFDAGLSTLATPGGSLNGILSITYPTANAGRTTQNASISQTYTHTNGSTAMFFGALGTYGTISNVSITTPPSVLGPKHLYPLDGFTIIPTGSQLFQNSSYNPLLHNVSGSRENSFLLDQDFDPPTPSYIRGALARNEGIPADYTLLVSASQLGWEGTATADVLLEFSEVPDSNYTTTAIINPRYNGSKVISADYNFYTGVPSESLAVGRSAEQGIIGLANPPFLLTQNKILYINGETGSWTGDISYGKTAAIDRNPINIAHFKSSLESKEYFGTTTFNIDQLIQIPFEEILNEQSPIITSSLINGSNENLIPVSSTFMYGREATIVYNQSSKTFNNIGGTILNYTNLGVGSNMINAGGIEFKAYQSNQRSLDITTIEQYYGLPIWYDYNIAKESRMYGNYITVNNPNIERTPLSASISITGSNTGFGIGYGGYNNPPNPLNTNNISNINSSGSIKYTPGTNEFYLESPQPIMLFTSSLLDENGRTQGILNLRGPNPGILPGMVFQRGTTVNQQNILGINGPSLSLFNSINKLISFGDIYPTGSSYTASQISIGVGYSNQSFVMPLLACSGQLLSNQAFINPGYIAGPLPVFNEFELKNSNNYYRWNISGSNLNEYRTSKNQIINIEKGDEIRVSYSYYVDPSNPGVVSKKYQDFTVLGYNLMPPNLWTTNVNMNATTSPKFEIRGTEVFPANYLFTPMTCNTTGPLPKDGFFNFTELWKRFRAAKNNNVIFNFFGQSDQSDNLRASGSIASLNTHSVIDGSGIIGVTMSLFDNNEMTGADANCCYNMSTNYLINYSSSMGYKSPVPSLHSNLIASGSISPIGIGIKSTVANSEFTQLDPGFLYDRLVVTPDPLTLDDQIPEGKIYAMTLRKRVEADDRVVLNVNQPSGSQGALTLSGDGYLIPNDMTDIQQRNVQKIINKLKSENVFTQDSPDNLGGSSA